MKNKQIQTTKKSLGKRIVVITIAVVIFLGFIIMPLIS